jgi:hypothetical protein
MIQCTPTQHNNKVGGGNNDHSFPYIPKLEATLKPTNRGMHLKGKLYSYNGSKLNKIE